MIVVSNRLQVAQGHEEDFEKRFEGRAVWSSTCRVLFVWKSFVRLKATIIVLTHWKDEASFRGWTDSAELKEAHRNRPPGKLRRAQRFRNARGDPAGGKLTRHNAFRVNPKFSNNPIRQNPSA